MRSEFEKGDLDAALRGIEALSARAPNLGADWIWRVRLLKAEVLVWRGNNDEVLSLLQEPVPGSLASQNYAARRLIFLGLAQGHARRFEESTENLRLAEQLASSSHPEVLGDLYLARGSIQVDQGNYEDAMKSYEIALQKAREFRLSFLEANATGSLGYASTWLERYDQAIDWYKASFASSESFGARATSAKTLGNLGWSYHELGDLQNALEQFQKAEKASAALGLDGDRAYWLLSAGTVEFDLGNWQSAESRMLEALKLADHLHDSSTVSECYENLALVAMQNGQFALARARLNQAEKTETAHPDFKHTQYNQLLSAQLDFRESRFDVAIRSLNQLALDRRAPTSLQWEARATLAQAYAAQKKDALAEKEFSESIATISHARDSIVHEDFRLSFLSSAIRFYDQYVNFLLQRNRPLDALAVADRSRAQTLEHGLSLAAGKNSEKPAAQKWFHPETTARAQKAVLLFYWLGQEKSYLWTIGPKGVSLFSLPPEPEIEALAKSYRLSFLDPRDPLDSMAGDGQKLYDILIRPAQKLIPANSRVVILPDGKLNGLNFDTLIVNEPQPHYWIEDATITVANSLALLERSSRMPPPNSPGLLLFGDALPATKEFPPLADSQKEIAALEKHIPENRRNMFTGAKAVASNYLSSNPGRYSYIHFATHGTASTSRPLESAIILSPEGDSYKLYARDIVKHPLNAYLVSISACNGVGERQFAGEGLVGLSWAFLRAGAHNVVAGLWEVSTASTPQIMDGLYKGVASGQDPATALRNAKLALVHSKGALSRPFYWGPFQLYSGS